MVGELAADPRLVPAGVAFSRFFAAEVVDEVLVQLSGREVEVLRSLAA